MPGNRAAMSLVLDEEDQVPRLERFRVGHPEVVILLLGAWPKAWLDGQKIEHPTLRGLLDELEEILPPERPTSSSSGSPQDSALEEQ
ncbi:MAG TPA: hypothetical protein VIY52_07810 [Streptosporangiaceae bacterium]